MRITLSGAGQNLGLTVEPGQQLEKSRIDATANVETASPRLRYLCRKPDQQPGALLLPWRKNVDAAGSEIDVGKRLNQLRHADEQSDQCSMASDAMRHPIKSYGHFACCFAKLLCVLRPLVVAVDDHRSVSNACRAGTHRMRLRSMLSRAIFRWVEEHSGKLMVRRQELTFEQHRVAVSWDRKRFVLVSLGSAIAHPPWCRASRSIVTLKATNQSLG
ncbi:hypothetical protein [Mesorhizobium sp. M7A.F.Ca.AU.002.02.1.1]|uniref:hypothetical protein n=1 Tax=Mesorhizobium sp. M7A.F.Ca.AU.002.02.1.1 TaxID=2496671 RepID=UPI001FE0BF33|nr:hypothetical protein [Mesorhizobium sp. M7A.F.Ca.AU.002.02.1.1]